MGARTLYAKENVHAIHHRSSEENSGSIDLSTKTTAQAADRPRARSPLSGASWERQLSPLLAAGYRIITYDRRGFGNSSKPTSGYNYNTLAGDLRKIITKLNLRDATIVGFSMGGGEVARYLGAYGSEQVSQAVFLSAIPPFLLQTPENPEGVPGIIFEGIKQAIVADRPAFLTKFFHDFYNVDVLAARASATKPCSSVGTSAQARLQKPLWTAFPRRWKTSAAISQRSRFPRS